MDNTSRHLVVVVNNDVTGDSRVLKTAISAARTGWQVTLLGRSSGRRREESRLGPIRVIRVPLLRTLHDRYEATRRARWATEALPSRLSAVLETADAAAARLPRGRTHATRVLVSARRHANVPPPDLRRPVLPEVSVDEIEWRRDWPVLTDWWLSFGPELVRLAPDVIHANDVQMLMVVARAASDLRLAGHTVSWLYDAHELVAEVNWGGPEVSAAYRQLEREYIGRADAVVTVSQSIAERMRDEYALDRVPEVVANAPVAQAPHSEHSIRSVCGLSSGTPLMVYSGYISPERGVDVAIDSLPHLHGVHLAIVANKVNPTLAALLERAERLGVHDRVHIAPYVSPFAVPTYLSSADLGLTPHHPDPNHQSSLPTKFAEYLHARLPIVASRMRTTAEFIERTGVGAVFDPSDPVDFARAATEVLENADAMRGAISEGLLDELSWERQARVLEATYERISGISPETPAEVMGWDAEEVVLPSAR
ncbi:glycosyltransferase family 4 protein [Knoellia aerolata]|uniref:glycosyltransferase family 4 protein n=1 Tax=Knoellia aerolata TaxID=442954 RepID=UPI00146FEA4A|nr:glycosyltransferase family 4 protein [Knoellia aerolata]